MPSSTSNFERQVPPQPWGRAGWLVAVLVVVFVAAWEVFWRSRGHRPSLNDTEDLWATQRIRLKAEGKDAVVFVGASRILFDIDLDVWTEATGKRPILLGIVGGSARPVLEDLAHEEAFSGTVVCGVMPSIFFSMGPPLWNAAGFVDAYHHWTPSERVSQHVAMALESRLAFLNKDMLSFNGLLTQFMTRYQENATPPIQVSTVLPDRRNLMLEQLEHDQAFQNRIRGVYQTMLARARTPPPPMLNMMMASIREWVDRIRARGGRVIFLRLPSTEDYRAIEAEKWPRAQFWDRLLAETGAPGIHFEDYPQLQGFECPEWSHLSAKDAPIFTKALMPIYLQVMKQDGGPSKE